jgi:hypothetical protein
MTEAEEGACPHDRRETAVEALNIPRENTGEGGAWVSEISEAEFWEESCAFAPIKRMGSRTGPARPSAASLGAFGIRRHRAPRRIPHRAFRHPGRL